MGQIQDISEAKEIYSKAITNLMGNSNEWKEFLKFSTKLYKYKFHENLLLFAQNRNATICAEYDEWKKVGRYVKPNSKSLKTLYYKNGRSYLKSVFDISDTNSKYNVDFKLWKSTEEQATEILEQYLDYSAKPRTFEEIIYTYLTEVVQNPDILEQLGLTDLEVYNGEFLETFFNSVGYIVANRCGFEYEKDVKCFDTINDTKILKSLGYLVNTCSCDLLKMIERELKEREVETYETNIISENEQNVGGNQTSKIPELDNGGNNKRVAREKLTGDSRSGGNNRRTIKKAISEARYKRVRSNSTVRGYDKKLENGTNAKNGGRKGKRNVEYNEGVEQTTLFSLAENSATPQENTFAGYKVGDWVYLESKEMKYIRNIDLEHNSVLVGSNETSNRDVDVEIYEIPKFEDLFYNNPLNDNLQEYNNEQDREKLAQITDVNTFEETVTPTKIISSPLPPPFRIPDNLKEESKSLKVKYEENIAAIKLLKQLEKEERPATDEEKLILVKYNRLGWII